MKLRFLSLFSGIECASLAWEPLGWECVAVAEVDKDACKVLAHRFPHVPNLGDVTKVTATDIHRLGHIDVVVFGSPCQCVSQAGKREGFYHDDGSLTRSGLFHVGLQIANWSHARFTVWENVKGAFSSNQGRDFAAVVGDLAGCPDLGPPENGWGTEGVALGPDGLVEWCTLDAQWFGLAQRRGRVFAVRDSGDWAAHPPILLERASLRGAAPPGGQARQEDSGGVGGGAAGCGGGKPLSYGFSAGNSADSRGIAFTEEATPPLRAGPSGTNQVPTVLTPVGVNVYGGNRRKDRPEGGFYVEMDATKTLDATGLDPCCNQGGTAVMQPVCYGLDDEQNAFLEQNIGAFPSF